MRRDYASSRPRTTGSLIRLGRRMLAANGWRGVASVLCDVSRLPNRDLNNFLVRRAGGVIRNDLRDLRGNGVRVEMHAAWLAVVRGKRIAEWRVYADNEPARTAMRH